MLLIVGALIVLMAAVLMAGLHVAHGRNTGALGWMSDQWMAAHRASSDSR